MKYGTPAPEEIVDYRLLVELEGKFDCVKLVAPNGDWIRIKWDAYYEGFEVSSIESLTIQPRVSNAIVVATR